MNIFVKNIVDAVRDWSKSLFAKKEELDSIESLIPSQANPDNQLADKAFVNSSVQTATANFRGNWFTWNDVPTNATIYPADYTGSTVPTVNDYIVIMDAVDFSSEYEGTWRFKYSGLWATDGKNGWQPEYQVNEEPLTSAQIAALNSGITSTQVTSFANKQDKLVSGSSIKTINNTSILGSGNIDVQAKLVNGVNIKSINGESLLGAGSVSTKVPFSDEYQDTGGDGQEFMLYADMFYMIGDLVPIISESYITFDTSDTGDGYNHTYHFILFTGDSAPTINWSDEGLIWADGAPSFEPNKAYEISMMWDLCYCKEFSFE